jgi:hypothetical protein
MQTSTEWPDATYFAEGAPGAQEILGQLELVESANWRDLYKRKSDGSLWSLDAWDKYQERFLVRVRNLSEWSTEDHMELEKSLFLAERGESNDPCRWANCGNKALSRMDFCVDHAYQQGLRR